MGERKSDWKNIIVGAVVFLVVSALAVTVITLWPEEESESTTSSYAGKISYTVEGPPDYESLDWCLKFSPEVLETVSLPEVREYLPAAASLTAITTSDGRYEGNYAVKDASGAEIGLVVLDIQGKISSERIYGLGYEKAEDTALGIIAERGIDPELLLLEHSDVHHASEHVTEYQFRYVPHIGGVPVHCLDHYCDITLNATDGSIMSIYLSGSFVLPGTTPTETKISQEEAVSLAVDEFSRAMEERYPIMQPYEAISFKLTEPVAFVYVIYNGKGEGITPVWSIHLARFVTTVNEQGDNCSINDCGGILYEVNATTGEVLETASW